MEAVVLQDCRSIEVGHLCKVEAALVTLPGMTPFKRDKKLKKLQI